MTSLLPGTICLVPNRVSFGFRRVKIRCYWWVIIACNFTLVALGVLEELKGKKKDVEGGVEAPSSSIEEQVGLFSAGVARVIIPTVINLMETMSTMESKPGER
jgi:hypothetical protein